MRQMPMRHAHEADAYETHAYHAEAYEVDAYEAHAYEMDAHEVHAREMHAHEVIYAYEMHAYEVIAEEPEMKSVTVVSLLSAIGRISVTTCWFSWAVPRWRGSLGWE